jgi:cardiolipin synthase A/B
MRHSSRISFGRRRIQNSRALACASALALLSILGFACSESVAPKVATSPATDAGTPATDAGFDAQSLLSIDATSDSQADSDAEANDAASWLDRLGLVGQVTYFGTPAADFSALIREIDGASKTIALTIFSFSNPQVADALVRAAARGVSVRVIIDHNKATGTTAAALRDGGVEVKASSAAFSLTHEKAFVIDATKSVIMSLNLTSAFARTRDFAVVVNDPGVAKEMLTVFEADWTNADADASATPPLSDPHLLWSPVNSDVKLTGLIASASSTIDSTVENLGVESVQSALLAAAARGVTVRLIVPLCDENPNPAFNHAPSKVLLDGGVQVKMMPSPATSTTPYMHQKMILVDGRAAYIGSVNFSFNSIAKARELGIVLRDDAVVRELQTHFAIDWAASVPVPAASPDCK